MFDREIAGADGALREVFVLCADRREEETWVRRRPAYVGVRITPILRPASACETIAALLADGRSRPFLVCRGDVWFGLEIAEQVADLERDLAATAPHWAVCGALGVLPDSGDTVSFLQHLHGGPTYRRRPVPVSVLDDAILLVNPAAFTDAAPDWPAVPGAAGAGLVLSLAALLRGRLVLADRRLLVALAEPRDPAATARVAADAAFRAWYGARFLNHLLLGVDGPLDMADAVDWRALDPTEDTRRADLVTLYDGALTAARRERPASVRVLCRTMMDRPALLRRAIRSFAAAAQEGAGLVSLSVLLVTTGAEETMAETVAAMRALAPGLPIEGRAFSVREGRHSRMDVLLQAIQSCDQDDGHLWMVDDDDFILPGAMPGIGRRLALDDGCLLVGASRRYEETWAGEGGTRCLDTWNPAPEWPADGILLALAGMNKTPICSMLAPVRAMKAAITGVSARGDYYEDYFLLLRLLTTQPVDVTVLPVAIAGISLRDTENTVTEVDRSRWHMSYATVMGEILRQPDHCMPLAWQMSSRCGGSMDASGEAGLPRWVRRLGMLTYAHRALRHGLTNPRALASRTGRFITLVRARGLRGALAAVIHYGRALR